MSDSGSLRMLKMAGSGSLFESNFFALSTVLPEWLEFMRWSDYGVFADQLYLEEFGAKWTIGS